jgi:tRNA(Ile)-lysidine synthase
MEPTRDNIYIRPLLATPRENIMAYIDEFGLEYVEDETNEDNTFSRNYLRNVVLPALRRHFKAVDKNLVNFADICAQDNGYIEKQIDMSTMIETKDFVKVPLTYFYQDQAIVNRIVMKVFERFSHQDFERRHVEIVRNFAIEADNGSMINLPFNVKVLKEYDYIVIGHIKKKEMIGEYPFASGRVKIDGYGAIRSTASKVRTEPKIHQHIIDSDKLPTTARWRFRQEGDVFSPLGLGGTKKLKEYFIDKKIPQRMRNEIPVLADGNKILVVADIEIADELKVTETTERFYKINYEKDLV